jgi:hypothetical protein
MDHDDSPGMSSGGEFNGMRLTLDEAHQTRQTDKEL